MVTRVNLRFISLRIALFSLMLTALAGGRFSIILADESAATQAVSPLLAGKNYASEAAEVTRDIQAKFYLPADGLYAHSLTSRRPDAMWGNGIMFSALLGAARHDPQTYSPIVSRFFQCMDHYWDTRDKVPGYEPWPTKGSGRNKYYDDNAWMVLTFTEAFDMTREPKYHDRARQTLDFVLSGWDEKRGGGIWWQEEHKDDSKNTCVNAPAALGCYRIAKYLPPDQAQLYLSTGDKLIEWTSKTFEASDGLYFDRIKVATGQVVQDELTYNTGLMIRALLARYRVTHNADDLRRANRSSAAADWFLDSNTHAYRDPPKWSHLLIEADLETYRATHDDALLRRAIDNADYEFEIWKKSPPTELIDNAAIARTLWLMADMQSEQGRQFWQRMDNP